MFARDLLLFNRLVPSKCVFTVRLTDRQFVEDGRQIWRLTDVRRRARGWIFKCQMVVSRYSCVNAVCFNAVSIVNAASIANSAFSLLLCMLFRVCIISGLLFNAACSVMNSWLVWDRPGWAGIGQDGLG